MVLGFIVLAGLSVIIILSLYFLWKSNVELKNKWNLDSSSPFYKDFVSNIDGRMKEEFVTLKTDNRSIGSESRKELREIFKSFQDSLVKILSESRQESNKMLLDNRQDVREAVKDLRMVVDEQLKNIREDNNKQITEMRKTVDEKLQSTLEKRLGESFKQVSERLELVHKGLGEMQNIAVGVGDLKKVLSNVKTRGILGEYQLGNILEQILSPQQYSHNVATKKGSQANVEYAVKLPGHEKGAELWIPIDSKFPLESYNRLLSAYDVGDKAALEIAEKKLLKSIELFAKEISEKYLDPPHTTNFAVMFLPVEGLYAEVLRHPGLFETLQRKHNITIVGPTTLSAFLNSLQMGYRTLALQKRSSEVWKVLASVKGEFEKFSAQLAKVNKQLRTVSGSLEELEHKRTNAMSRRLQSVEVLDSLDSKEPLEIAVTPLAKNT
ncbi:MAG: DNA recombination protein RmuC [Bdellovibrionaceae bacterium]|nr:DNA recombination protein RmuC [Pseudobdellovibrionaceae bacterium]